MPKIGILSGMKQATNKIPFRRPTKNDILPITANLIPVFGVAFWGWSAIEAFTVYAMETLIVGILTLLKMLVAMLARNTREDWYNGSQTTKVGGLFLMVFFTFHYGMFAAIQTSIFSGVAGIEPRGAGPLYFFLNWYKFINEHTAYALCAFVVSYFASNFVPFIVSGDYKKTPMIYLMFQPYGRIIVQQFTVILGSMMLLFKFGIGFMIIFIVVKMCVEMFIDYNKIVGQTVEQMKQNA